VQRQELGQIQLVQQQLALQAQVLEPLLEPQEQMRLLRQ
jgi:hypothetical protein